MVSDRYRVTPKDLSKRKVGRRSEVLKLLQRGQVSPAWLADQWKVHPTTTFRLLERLRKRGYTIREGNGINAVYSITVRGVDRLPGYQQMDDLRTARLGVFSAQSREEPEVPSPSPLSDSLEALSQHPIALMRLIDVPFVDLVQDGIDSLPGHGTLSDDDLVIERKADGWLVQAINGRLYSRRGLELTAKFPLIARALPDNAFLIGELIYLNPRGKQDQPSVTAVAGTDNPREAIAKAKMLGGSFWVIFFDLLQIDGEDLSGRPWKERRARLESIDLERPLVLSDIYDFTEWKEAFRISVEEGGEGVVIKNRKSPYHWRPAGQAEARPRGVWWKSKRQQSENFIAMSPYKTDKDKLMIILSQIHQGRFMPIQELNNFSAATGKEMIERIAAGGGATLIEVGYQSRSQNLPGKMRNAVFMRFRDDAPVESALLPTKHTPG